MLASLGPKVKFALAVLHASKTFYINFRAGCLNKIEIHNDEISPEKCVDYVKQLLKNGNDWNGGVGRYLALQHKGSILYGIVSHLMKGIMANAYKWEKWAINLMSLLDDECSVKEEKAYDEKGSSFLEGF